MADEHFIVGLMSVVKMQVYSDASVDQSIVVEVVVSNIFSPPWLDK